MSVGLFSRDSGSHFHIDFDCTKTVSLTSEATFSENAPRAIARVLQVDYDFWVQHTQILDGV